MLRYDSEINCLDKKLDKVSSNDYHLIDIILEILSYDSLLLNQKSHNEGNI